jgi:hypothetical protein
MLSSILFISTFINLLIIKGFINYFLSEKTNEMNNTLEFYFNERDLLLSTMDEEPVIQKYLLTGENSEDIQAVLESQQSKYDSTSNWYITGKDGIVLIDGIGGKAVGLDITTYPMWEWIKSHDEYYLENTIIKSHLTDDLLQVVAKRIEDKKGKDGREDCKW